MTIINKFVFQDLSENWLNCWFVIFQGAGKEIREAISDPTPEVQERAWVVVLPLVEKLKACYEHSLELEKIVPKLLGQLVGGRLNPTQHLETQQALVKQLAEILEFVLKFDEYKVSSVVEWKKKPNKISSASIDSTDENTRDPERLQLLQTHSKSPATRLQQSAPH